MEPFRWIDQAMLDGLVQRASSSPRLRLNLNFHQTLEENPHRFLNAMQRRTYVRPHRHLNPPKPESFVLLSGAVLFLLFDDDGAIAEERLLVSPALLGAGGSSGTITSHPEIERLRSELRSRPALGVDIDPGLWHTLLPVTDEAVIFEVKPGPYRPSDDKEFAPWSPAEDDPDAMAYLDELYSLCYENSHNSQ